MFGPGSAEPQALRARAVVPDPWRKALSPAGYSVGGLTFADPLARRLLATGGSAAELVAELGLVVLEGEPDFLAWATRFGSDGGLERAPAVLGVESGAWTPELAALVPDGTQIFVRTHGDQAGDRYAERINQTLGDRCRVLRVVAPMETAP